MFKNFIALFLLVGTFSAASGQHADKYFIRNYTRNDYQASIANFSVIQDGNGIIYAANYHGVLVYSGTTWDLISLPENSLAFSLASDHNNKIYIGLNNDFGYLKPDHRGALNYISLRDKLPRNTDISLISRIVTTPQGVYFFSTETIFYMDEAEEIHLIDAGSFTFGFSLHKFDDTAFCIQNKKGLVALRKDSIEIIFDTDVIPSTLNINYVDRLSSDEILLGTSDAGLFKVKNSSIEKISSELSKFLSTKTLITGAKIISFDSSSLFLGTFGNGIVKTNNHLQEFSTINKASGLQSDIVRNLFVDHHNNLWAAMQEGVSHIEVNSPWMYWNEEDGLEGTAWDIIRNDGLLYVATTSGLFYLNNQKFTKVKNLDSKVWSLCTIKKSPSSKSILLAGSENGLYEVNMDKASLVPEASHITAITKIYSSPKHPEKVIVCSRYGIDEITFSINKNTESKITELPRSTFSSILRTSEGDLLAAAKSKGIYNLSDTTNNLIYNKSHGLPDVNDISMIYNGNKVLFATNHGIYRFDEQRPENKGSVKFIMDTSLFSYPVNIGVIAKNRKGEFYLSVVSGNRQEYIEKLSPSGSGSYTHESIPFRRLPDMEIIQIYPEDNGVTWIAGSEGLFRYDETVKKDYTLPFNTVIGKAYVNDSVIFYGLYSKKVEDSAIPQIGLVQPEEYKPTLTFADNNITFEYSATSYEMPEKNQFSYFLANNDKGWSSWTYETKKEYNNLRPGKYTFHVKSKNIYDTEGKVATYQFTVLAPWYQTAWAYAGYTVLAGFFVWFVTIAYSVRVRMQRKKLQLIVADRTYEVMTQKKEIEQQNHLLKIKNDEISLQKDDIQKKNIQLRESQEEVLMMNQKLTELNLYLEKKVETRTSKIKATLKQLQQTNSELDTFVYRASHDLKGPISRINGITSLAKLESPDHINLKYFDMIEHTAKDMEVLLSKLAQVHEIINTDLKNEDIDIPSLLSEVRDSIKFLDKGPQTKYSFDLNVIMLYSDRYLLSIIIKNLIENALIFRKAVSSEPHHIKISTSLTSDFFTIKIRDNGIGIHAPHINLVFQMFFRGSDKSKGSGLGLYLVKMCVDKLDASINVESIENQFTEFVVTIPISQ